MKRSSRRVFNALAVASLLLCVAAVALWVRSRHWQDELARTDHGRWLRVGSSHGELYWDSAGNDPRTPQSPARTLWLHRRNDEAWFAGSVESVRGKGGVYWDLEYFNASGETASLGGPHPSACSGRVATWQLVLGAAALPACLCVRWLVARHRRSRRESLGHCPGCGFDVRAKPGGGALLGRCPECGAVSSASATP